MSTITTDALVIGAGPVGLYQVFQLGLLDMRVQVVDSLAYPGGQCIELYPDKPIYDIPAVPFCTGRELVDKLLQQVAPFKQTFHLGQEVTAVEKQADGQFLVATSASTRFLTKTIFIAAGVGAFQPKLLRLPGIERHQGQQLHYRLRDAADFAGQAVVVVGGGDAAVDAALALVNAGTAAKVTLVHRRDVFQAPEVTLSAMRAAIASGALQLVIGQVTGFEENDGRLTAATLTQPDGSELSLPLDALLVFYGLSPKLGAIADWGLAIERKQLVVDTEKFSTSEPGIFAVGDINTYPGKKKLIVCGFHECVLAAFGAAAIVFPDQTIHLQYTTTSPKLHRLLGVETPSSD